MQCPVSMPRRSVPDICAVTCANSPLKVLPASLCYQVFLAFGLLCVHVTPNLQLSNALSGISFGM